MNILAIGAHFDDIELGCGGTLAKHVSKGDQVYAYVATSSGYSGPDSQTIRSNQVAREEGARAMELLGVELICGSFETFMVEFGEALNLELLNVIEQQEIHTVYTHWDGDIHHDHSAVAKASLHASRHVKNLFTYRSNWYPSGRSFHGNYFVDISAFMETKMSAIEAHQSELQRTGNTWIDFFKNEAANNGRRIGVAFAEAFEVVKCLR